MKCIYKIENRLNNRIYIGSAINFNNRKSKHLFKLRKGIHHSPILQNAWNKYGEDNFIFSIIENILVNNHLLVREQYYIDTLKPYYNCCKIAGNRLGLRHSKETRDKISKGLKEKFTRDPHPMKGKTLTAFSKNQISNSLVKAITQYDLQGNKIQEWRSSIDAEEKLGINRVNINQCCNNKTKTSGGYRWTFSIDPLKELEIHKGSKPVISMKDGIIIEYKSFKDAEEKTGVKSCNIGLCCNGFRKKSGGYYWKFKN